MLSLVFFSFSQSHSFAHILSCSSIAGFYFNKNAPFGYLFIGWNPKKIKKRYCFPVNQQLLTMDVTELTLLLKSIGFRLESIDYDELRCWGKKTNDNGNASTAINSARTDVSSAAGTVATDQQHYINVEISCSKSRLVSHLSLKFNEGVEKGAADAQAHPIADSSKVIACSCPKRETRNANSSFWEVQSSGKFVNQRRSINSLMVSKRKNKKLFIDKLRMIKTYSFDEKTFFFFF